MFDLLRSYRQSGAIAAGLFVLLSMPLAGTAHAYQCKVIYKYAEAIAPTLAQSKASAKTIWANKVKNAYGLPWSSWDIAKQKTLNCDFTGNNYWCRAKAKPCLYVVP